MKLTSTQLARIFVEQTSGLEPGMLPEAAEAFIGFLAERGEVYRIQEILRSIDAIWIEKFGAANVTIESAHPLSTEARKALEGAVAGADIREKVNPELIGGACIRIDDRIIDGSLKGKLNALETHLEA